MARLPLELVLHDAAESPIYQRIACKALQLHELGLNNSAIARRLGVTDKTVASALEWGRLD